MIHSIHSHRPWRFEGKVNRQGVLQSPYSIVAADGERIMGETGQYCFVPDYLPDWLLIAAAPEMLEALEDAYELLEDGHCQETKANIRRIIAKVRGQI